MSQKRLMLILLAVCVIAVPVSADENAFTVRCEPLAITFLYFGQPAIQVNRQQAAATLIVAVNQQENQPIALGTEFAVWALQSNELQVHRRENPDGTKAIFSPDICGVITPPTAYTGQAVAIARSNGGTAAAYASANPNGTVAIASASNGGFASAYAQSSSGYAPMPTTCQYIVQAGDTLYSIAERYNTTVEALSTANGLGDPSEIEIGTRLDVPCENSAAVLPPSGDYPACVDGNTSYIIREGDTLYGLSVRYGTSVAVIAAANGIDNPAYVAVGQRITIPCEI